MRFTERGPTERLDRSELLLNRTALGFPKLLQSAFGGWGGIRTHEGLAPLPVFKTGAFNRSATHPIPASFGSGRSRTLGMRLA
jgi:hypothetical protein